MKSFKTFLDEAIKEIEIFPTEDGLKLSEEDVVKMFDMDGIDIEKVSVGSFADSNLKINRFAEQTYRETVSDLSGTPQENLKLMAMSLYVKDEDGSIKRGMGVPYIKVGKSIYILHREFDFISSQKVISDTQTLGKNWMKNFLVWAKQLPEIEEIVFPAILQRSISIFQKMGFELYQDDKWGPIMVYKA